MTFKSLTIILALSSSATFAGGQWKIQRNKDVMTDEVSYFVYTPGSKVEINDFMSYKPDLVVKVTPRKTDNKGAIYFEADIMIQIENEGLKRDECEIMTRYDSKKATIETWNTSTDRRAAFSPNWNKTLDQIKSSTNLTVRYMTTLGSVRTSTFSVIGLNDALHKLKDQHLKSK